MRNVGISGRVVARTAVHNTLRPVILPSCWYARAGRSAAAAAAAVGRTGGGGARLIARAIGATFARARLQAASFALSPRFFPTPRHVLPPAYFHARSR